LLAGVQVRDQSISLSRKNFYRIFQSYLKPGAASEDSLSGNFGKIADQHTRPIFIKASQIISASVTTVEKAAIKELQVISYAEFPDYAGRGQEMRKRVQIDL